MKIAKGIKRVLTICLTSLFLISFAAAKEYRMSSVQYVCSGITKANALQRVVPIDTKRVFSSYEALDAYITDIVQQLENLRLLDNINSEYVCQDEVDNISPVTLTIKVDDSKHFLALPKLSYDSNSGSELKLKMKDTNFLGLLNTLNFDFNGQLAQETESDTPDVVLGINFDYDYPFQIFTLQNTWNNDFSFNWTLGNSKPEFSYKTGLTVNIPLGQHYLEASFKQSIIREEDYEPYGDELYAVEAAKISLPLTIGLINNTTKVQY